jgi:catechol 2,3-dioxygenase-like lactoylglutathione lyase family enzyme
LGGACHWIDNVRQDVAMLRTPDGNGRIELAMFHTPKAISPEPKDAPANTLGIGRVMFAVDDIEDVVARLRAHGAELVGELERHEDVYRLCYVRGPEGIIVGLAEHAQLKATEGAQRPRTSGHARRPGASASPPS